MDRWVAINQCEAMEKSKVYLGDYMRSLVKSRRWFAEE